jgi:predicted RNase H-like HicB family nuclease
LFFVRLVLSFWTTQSGLKTVTLSAVLNPEDNGYVSLCPELDIASQGDTVEDALVSLKEALEGFFEIANPEEILLLKISAVPSSIYYCVAVF